MQLTIEIRAGEGGGDAKLLVEKQSQIYLRYAARHHLQSTIVSESPAGLG